MSNDSVRPRVPRSPCARCARAARCIAGRVLATGLALAVPALHAWQLDPSLSLPGQRATAMASTGVMQVPPAAQVAGRAWARWLEAVTDNPVLAEAQAQADAAEARHQRSARQATWPRLDLQATEQRDRQVGEGRTVVAPAGSYSLTVSMPLWRPADQREVQGLQAAGQASRQKAHGTRLDVALDVSQAYLSALHAQARATVRARQMDELHALAGVQERLLAAGLLTVVDVQATRSQSLQVRDQWLQDQGDAAQQLWSLRRLVGPTATLPRGLHALPSGRAPIPWQDLAPGEITAQVREHPLALAADAHIRAAQARTEARQAGRWLPVVDASASRGHRRLTQRFEGLADRQSLRNDTVGVSLQWPLFGADSLGDGERIAAAELAEAQARRDAVLAELTRDMQGALEAHDLAEQQQTTRADWLAHAELARDAVHRAWLAGLRPTADRLRAQQAVLDAALALVDARIARMRSGARVLALLGRLDAPHIAPWLAEIDHPASDLPPP